MSAFLKVNEHPAERIVRVLFGVTLIGLAASGTVGMWGYIGLVPIATGLAGTCPLYSVFGISTCPMPKTKA